MLSTTNNQYRKRHFILHEYILSWYKTSSEASNSSVARLIIILVVP